MVSLEHAGQLLTAPIKTELVAPSDKLFLDSAIWNTWYVLLSYACAHRAPTDTRTHRRVRAPTHTRTHMRVHTHTTLVQISLFLCSLWFSRASQTRFGHLHVALCSPNSHTRSLCCKRHFRFTNFPGLAYNGGGQ